jgi:hypothetical protein
MKRKNTLKTRQLVRIATRRAGGFNGNYPLEKDNFRSALCFGVGVLLTPFAWPVGLGLIALGSHETNNQRRYRERQERAAQATQTKVKVLPVQKAPALDVSKAPALDVSKVPQEPTEYDKLIAEQIRQDKLKKVQQPVTAEQLKKRLKKTRKERRVLGDSLSDFLREVR